MTKIKEPIKTFTIKRPDGKNVTIEKPGKTFIIRKKPNSGLESDNSSDTKSSP